MEGLYLYYPPLNEFEYLPGETLLSHWIWPWGACALYLLVVVLGLPKWMAARPAYSLRGVLIIHNYFLFLWSLIMWLGMVASLVQAYVRHGGIYVLVCDPEDVFVGRRSLFFWCWLFYISKFYELGDTLLLALRKRPISFLQWYHHAMTLLLAWICLQERLPTQWMPQLLNCTVHIPMYYYFYLRARGVPVWWRNYLTQLQIVQFVVVCIWSGVLYYLYGGEASPCVSYKDSWADEFGIALYLSYLFLFLQFYYHSYISTARAATEGKNK